jgi:hypothetical protein
MLVCSPDGRSATPAQPNGDLRRGDRNGGRVGLGTGLEIPIRSYGLGRSRTDLPGYVRFLVPLPSALSDLVRAYTPPSGGNCGGNP